MSDVVNTCPICCRGLMQPSDINVLLSEVLQRWEDVVPATLKETLWQDYKESSDTSITLHVCDTCEFGQFHPIVPGTSHFYQAIAALDYYNNDKWEFDLAATDIEKSGARTILDVGCGSGLFLDFLRTRLPDTVLSGYELNEQLLDDLNKRGYHTLPVDLSSIDTNGAKPLQFDVICMLQVLEHVENPVVFLETFLPFLKPGGKLIITTPNAAGPIKAFPNALTEVPPHHTTRWTESSFRALLGSRNLQIESMVLEPLPDYLWDSYLPVMWDEPIWPALIFDPIARKRGLVEVGARAGFAAKAMRAAGIRWLRDVPGHTIFVSSRLTDTKGGA